MQPTSLNTDQISLISRAIQSAEIQYTTRGELLPLLSLFSTRNVFISSDESNIMQKAQKLHILHNQVESQYREFLQLMAEASAICTSSDAASAHETCQNLVAWSAKTRKLVRHSDRYNVDLKWIPNPNAWHGFILYKCCVLYATCQSYISPTDQELPQ